MAVSLSQVERSTVFGDRRIKFYTVTFDSSYPTGGEPLSAATLGFQRVDFVMAEPAAAAAGTTAVIAKYDYTNSTLQLFESGGAINAPLAEVTAAQDQSLTPCRIMVVGV